jgi:aminomethyltransferase
MLAVQGPEARAAVAALASAELPERMHTATMEVAGAPALVCGTGYTGEDGVEVILGKDGAVPLWRELIAAGVTPCGLGARDTLRLEVCFHLHGNDMGPDRNPILAAGEPAGTVTSGRFSPSLGIGIGMGYVRADLAEPGTAIAIDVRGTRREAEIRKKPLYAKSN